MRSVTMFVRNDLRNDSRVWKEATLLSAQGWSVRLIGVRSPQTAPRERVKDIDVVRVPVRSLDTRILKPIFGGEQPQFERAASGVAMPRPGRAKPVRRLKSALRNAWAPIHDELLTREFTRQALKVVRENPSDVYHGHDLNAMRPALAAKRDRGGKVVFDAHEFFTERNFYRKPGPRELARLRAEEADACRGADACITVSQGIAIELERRYQLKERPAVVMNCPVAAPVLAASQALSDKLGIAGKVLLYIGLATFNRGIEQTIAAMAGHPDWHLALVGPVQHGYRSELERHATGAGVAARVHFMGPVASEQVSTVAAGADAAIILIQNVCLSYYHCSPNKLFEALAAGLPVVASNFPDLARVLEGKGVGVVCPPDNPQAIAGAIAEVLRYPREALRIRARQLASEYTWEREGETLNKIYERLAPRKNYEHESV